MKWLHDEFRDLVVKMGMTQDELAAKLGVTRQTVSTWFSGTVPKGIHLMKIWKLLGMKPGSLFLDDEQAVFLTKPLFHSTDPTQRAAQKDESDRLVALYKSLFPKSDAAPLQSAILPSRDACLAKALAQVFRERMTLVEGASPTLAQVLKLLGNLNFCIIPREFPEGLGADAFYVSINYIRVMFINRRAKKDDLARALIHESVHGLRPPVNEELVGGELEAEEHYCDDVVSLVFPAAGSEGEKTLEASMFSMDETSQFVSYLRQHFDVWYGIVKANVDSLSASRLAEVLDIPRIDAEAFVRCVKEDDGL